MRFGVGIRSCDGPFGHLVLNKHDQRTVVAILTILNILDAQRWCFSHRENIKLLSQFRCFGSLEMKDRELFCTSAEFVAELTKLYIRL